MRSAEQQAIDQGVKFLQRAETAPRDGVGEEAAAIIIEQVEEVLTALIAHTEDLDLGEARLWLEALAYPHISPSPNHR